MLAAASVLLVAGCTGTSRPAAAPTSTATSVPTSTVPTPTATASTSGPTASTAPAGNQPTLSTRRVTDAAGVVREILTATGRGTATIDIPGSIGPPAIVHASYRGTASFVVNGVDARARHVTALTTATGRYDGTFPVGFIDPAGDPTVRLLVVTIGAWQLDVASPELAPSLAGSGESGRGDAVLSYTGGSVGARVACSGTGNFTVAAYARHVLAVLAATACPFTGSVRLPAGPAFVYVTAGGDWSMSLEAAGAR